MANGNGKTGMTCSCAGPLGCNCVHGCGCGCGGHRHHWTFFLLRTLLTIIILMIVFWFGVVAGRLGDYGWARYGYMYPTGVYNGAGGTGVAMPMMRINGATTTVTTPAGGVQNY